MSITDPISDMITLLRNAYSGGNEKVDVRASRTNEKIISILQAEKFIQNYKRTNGTIRVYLKFGPDKEPSVKKIRRVSKPGLRIYKKKDDIKPLMGGLGVSIVSTSQGIMTDKESREKNLGGEVMLEVW